MTSHTPMPDTTVWGTSPRQCQAPPPGKCHRGSSRHPVASPRSLPCTQKCRPAGHCTSRQEAQATPTTKPPAPKSATTPNLTAPVTNTHCKRMHTIHESFTGWGAGLVTTQADSRHVRDDQGLGAPRGLAKRHGHRGAHGKLRARGCGASWQKGRTQWRREQEMIR